MRLKSLKAHVMKSGLLVLVGALLVVVPFGFTSAFAQTKPFVFTIGWVPYGRDAYWYTALYKGFYKEEGLTGLEMVRGFGADDTMKKVAAGVFTMGAGIPPVVQLGAWRQGISSKVVMTQHDIAPMVIWTLKDRGINSVADLVGRSFGVTEADASWPNLKLLFTIKGLDLNKLRLVSVSGEVRDAGMIAGRYDASSGFIVQLPILSRVAKQQGKEIHYILMAKEGLEVYGTGVGALDSTLRDRPEDVRKFVRASVRGIAYAMQHPDEALDLFMKVCPTCDRENNREVWDITVDLWMTKAAYETGLTSMTDAKWQKTIDFVSIPLQLKEKPKPSDLYTNAYLPGIKPPERGPRKAPKIDLPAD